jgi:Mrp family chromosome partitioning ATPase
MSITDQAFIRAYRQDAPATSPSSRQAESMRVASASEDLAMQWWRLDEAHDRLVPHLATFGGEGFAQGTTTMPLSAFKGQQIEQAVQSEARPALEVDSVRWPDVCETLLDQCAERFDALAERIANEAAAGCKVLAICGVRRGEGRTTFSLCLARSLAKKLNVALVDADFAKPALAKQLGLEVGLGWEAACCHGDSIWEAAIESMDDHLTLVPLGRAIGDAELASAHYQIAAAIETLGQQYDLVLLDAGTLDTDRPQLQQTSTRWLNDPAIGIDGIILAHDVRNSDGSRLAAACLQLSETGRRQLGIAEMFVEENQR